MNNLRNTIIETIQKIAEENDFEIVKSLNDETVLLESGLDSLGFAILVSELEGILGYDPFVLMAEPVYPVTLSDFVAVYERFKDYESSKC